MKSLWLAGGLLAVAQAADGPVTITSFDMFNEAGQYYRAYAADTATDVSGLTGSPGPDQQVWSFATGPEDDVFRFDYLNPSAAGDIAALFPLAQLVERKTEESDGGIAMMFLDQQAGRGRVNFGFWDPATVQAGFDDPSGIFDPPLLDFPESITLGSSWNATGTFLNSTLTVPTRVIYSATAGADAWGIVTLPKLGFVDCIRVNELAEYTIQVDLNFGIDPETGEPVEGGNYETLAVYYVRTLYWMAKGKGIVVQITSQESATPPPDSFSSAAQFVRMFETNHPKGSTDPLPVTDLRVDRNDDRVLLSWTKPLNASSFRVEYAARLGFSAIWETLTTTTSNFALDTIPRTGNRLYRVVSLP